jgi:hypothetical protein
MAAKASDDETATAARDELEKASQIRGAAGKPD